MTYLYLLLCVVGAVLPLAAFWPWLLEHGFDIHALLTEIVTSRVALFAWLDVLISAVCLWFFIVFENRRIAVPHRWAPIMGTLTIGVSFGLPLYLLLRQRAIAQRN